MKVRVRVRVGVCCCRVRKRLTVLGALALAVTVAVMQGGADLRGGDVCGVAGLANALGDPEVHGIPARAHTYMAVPCDHDGRAGQGRAGQGGLTCPCE